MNVRRQVHMYLLRTHWTSHQRTALQSVNPCAAQAISSYPSVVMLQLPLARPVSLDVLWWIEARVIPNEAPTLGIDMMGMDAARCGQVLCLTFNWQHKWQLQLAL